MKNKKEIIKQNNFTKRPALKHPGISKSLTYWCLVIILIISFFSYYSILHNGFVNWDDDDYIRNNPLVHSINLKNIFSQNVMGNYHPLTILAIAIQYYFFELKESNYHLISLLLHLFNVVLVYFTIIHLSERVTIALIASLLFGIHPIHVESVAWAADQKDLLYTFFFLASYICYIKYIKNLHKLYYLLSFIFFILSLFSKAVAVTLPLIFILTDYFKERKINLKSLLEKIPFFVLSIIFGILAIFAQREGGAINDVAIFTLPQRVVFASYGFINYLYHLIIPLNLSAIYPYPIKTGADMPTQYYLYLIVLILFIAYVIFTLKSSKKIFFGISFFSITLFLVLQLLPVGQAVVADRYAYIPSIGIFYLAGEGLYLLWIKKYKTIVITLLSVFSILYITQTFARSKIWKDSFSLWNDVISKYKTVPVAYNNRGYYLKNHNNYKDALIDYNKALEIDSDYYLAYNNRANLYLKQNENDVALKDYNKAIKLKPDFVEAYNNRGYVLYKKENNEMALSDYNKAIELKPDFAAVYNNRGILYIKEKKYESAIKDFTTAIDLKTDLAENYFNKGVAEYYLGKKEACCLDWQKAIDFGCEPAVKEFNNYCR